jgi:hypothetical protein
MTASQLGHDVSLPQHLEGRTMMKGHNYVIYAEDAVRDPQVVGFADTIEEARKIKFDAELAGFTHAAIVNGDLKEVE